MLEEVRERGSEREEGGSQIIPTRGDKVKKREKN